MTTLALMCEKEEIKPNFWESIVCLVPEDQIICTRSLSVLKDAVYRSTIAAGRIPFDIIASSKKKFAGISIWVQGLIS